MIKYRRIKQDFSSVELFWYLVMTLSVVLGIFFRFKGLGKWPLASTDEYFIGKSVHNIIRCGLPAFELGGFYTRGLFQQYISAALISFGIRDELALRLIPVLSNILTIPAVYLLAKKIGGRTVSVASVILFSLSIWEIEIARYARMYAPFQMLFLWYILFLYMVIVEKNHKVEKWLYLISFLSILVFEAAFFLVLLNFFPFVYYAYRGEYKKHLPRFLLSLLLLGIAYFFLSTNFRFWGVKNPFPANLSLSNLSQTPVDFPYLFLTTIFRNSFWSVSFILPLGITIFFTYNIFKRRELPLLKAFVPVLFMLLSLLNLFGVIFYLFLMMYFIRWLKNEDFQTSAFKYSMVSILINLVFWIVFGLTTTSWHSFFPGMEQAHTLRKLLIVLIDYPPVYDKIISEYWEAIPLFSVIVGIITVFGVFYVLIRNNRSDEGARFLFFVGLFHNVLIGVLNTPYHNTRYSFFLYPLLLILFVQSLKWIVEMFVPKGTVPQLSMVILLGLFLWFSEDFNLAHLTHIDSKEVNFRMNYNINSSRAAHVIRRFEVRTPAEFVNRQMSPEDIIITSIYPVEYYLKRMDYFYRNMNRKTFTSISMQYGERERWTNARLLKTESELLNLLTFPGKTIWFISYSPEYKNSSPEERKIARLYRKNLVYTSLDGMVLVYKFHRT